MRIIVANKKRLLVLLCIFVLLIVFALIAICFGLWVNGIKNTSLPQSNNINNTSGGSGLTVIGNKLVDSNGKAIILRGAQIESAFNYIKQWRNGIDPLSVLNSATFNEMANVWKMNEVRIPISNWEYTLPGYMSKLDTAVSEANKAGLYVVLDLHDDDQSGSTYPKGTDFPKLEDVTFWKSIANHFKTNQMVLFDLYNEPQTGVSWSEWLNGGGNVNGATQVGMQDLVNAVRGTGANQVIIVEPGGAGGKGKWVGMDNYTIADKSVMYSLHYYAAIINGNQSTWNSDWGYLLGKYPLFYGEWAFLPNANYPSFCKGATIQSATNAVNSFLSYTQNLGISWNAWSFTKSHLITDNSTYTPTTLNSNWICGDKNSNAGMGELIKNYLVNIGN